ncbi:ABC transporter permease [Dyella japonica]|uniref:ABC transporter ATP-binding protein n=1 Tax=Dyella japonica A8 TaxID=1217721 RepID=A0A075K0Y6_9GAMM|nr:ABC transporter permease [Dyella japonica]AIF45918.1 ABC transporter ATP-binding protein [Dyella japonica A8]
MIGYYAATAISSLRRSKALAILMILVIGLGIGASMTMITIFHVLSGDPLPGRSGQLYAPVIDPRPLARDRSEPGEPDGNFTWPDAMNLLRAHRADRQAVMAGGAVPVRPPQGGQLPFYEAGRYVTADFFAMFNAPFAAGGGWRSDEDDAHARVVVLNSELNRKLFGDASGVGHTVRLKNTDFRVVGVLDAWNPQPQFYAQINGRVYGKADQFFLPLQTAQDLGLDFNGRFSCWDGGGDARTSDHCVWLQFWVQLDTTAKAVAYRDFLGHYWHQQQAHGRMPRPASPQLFGLMDWLARQHAIPDDLRLQLSLSLGFLAVCMLNVVGLLLATFLRRGGEISVRRALGARRWEIFLQLGVESCVIGLAGGSLGLGIAFLGLWSVRQRPDGYAQLAQMDASMLFGTFALALVASVIAGLLPAWRACRIPPALQLKTQ